MVSALLSLPRSRGVRALGLVLAASLGVQLSALLAHALFDRLGPLGVSGLRFAIAAALACVLVRPRWRGRSPLRWAAIACFGASIASMNLFNGLQMTKQEYEEHGAYLIDSKCN